MTTKWLHLPSGNVIDISGCHIEFDGNTVKVTPSQHWGTMHQGHKKFTGDDAAALRAWAKKIPVVEME